MKKLQLTTMKVADIQEAPYNPREISEEAKAALKESLRRFGLVEPLIWNKRSKVLVSGHQRLKVLREEKVKEVQVVVLDLPVEEEKALNVTLNNPAVGGHWDALSLERQLAEIQEGIPDAFDSLQMFELHGEGDTKAEPRKHRDTISDPGMGVHPDMELQAFEHYDYLVLFFKNPSDYAKAIRHFGVKEVNYSPTSKKKIGIGRCLDGKKYLDKIEGKPNG